MEVLMGEGLEMCLSDGAWCADALWVGVVLLGSLALALAVQVQGALRARRLSELREARRARRLARLGRGGEA